MAYNHENSVHVRAEVKFNQSAKRSKLKVRPHLYGLGGKGLILWCDFLMFCG